MAIVSVDRVKVLICREQDPPIGSVPPVHHTPVDPYGANVRIAGKRIETPFFLPSGSVQRNELQLRCSAIQDTTNYQGVTLDLREIVLSGVTRTIRPRHLKPADILSSYFLE